jgi:heptosyltransferase-1
MGPLLKCLLVEKSENHMRVLIVKTTSLGDIIHLLPALTDAQAAIPGIRFDWVVEGSFREVPTWHAAVDRIIPVRFRQWRKEPFSKKTKEAWRLFKNSVRERHYDKVIDAQGLIKSAFLARKALGPRYGLGFRSAWEPLASFTYHHRVSVDPTQHAVVRMRRLMAGCLGYECPTTTPDYGIKAAKIAENNTIAGISPQHLSSAENIIFIHGTTWTTKEWPVIYWQQLLQLVATAGYRVLIPWGNEAEFERAKTIALAHPNAQVLPKLSLAEITAVLANASGAVAVDTGIGHLAAALALPTVSLYGPTDPLATGAMGANQVHLSPQFACAPCFGEQCRYSGESSVKPACFETIAPLRVWQSLQALLELAVVV